MLLCKTEDLFLVGQNYFKQTIIPSNLDVCGFEFWEFFEGLVLNHIMWTFYCHFLKSFNRHPLCKLKILIFESRGMQGFFIEFSIELGVCWRLLHLGGIE